MWCLPPTRTAVTSAASSMPLFTLVAVTSDSCWALALARAKTWFAHKPQRLDRLGATGA